MDNMRVLFVLMWIGYSVLILIFFSSVTLTLWRCFVTNPENQKRAVETFRSGTAAHYGMVIDPVTGLVKPTRSPCRPTSVSVLRPLVTAILSGYILFMP